jgi:transposase
MKHFAGLDVSLEETAICIVDADGMIVREGKAASEPLSIIGLYPQSRRAR